MSSSTSSREPIAAVAETDRSRMGRTAVTTTRKRRNSLAVVTYLLVFGLGIYLCAFARILLLEDAHFFLRLVREDDDVESGRRRRHVGVDDPKSRDDREILRRGGGATTPDADANELASSLFGPSVWEDAKVTPLTLSAYLEPATRPLWVPGTATDKNPFGDLISPPPLRTQTPSDLKRFDYPDVRSCADVPKRWPVIRGLERDAKGELVFQNVHNHKVLEDPLSEAHVCPVDADPFLPWIHDVFPNAAGDRVHFIAQNKRRCNQGKNFKIEKERLEPQVAIFQGVSVAEVVDPADVPSELWDDDGATPSTEKRWRLSTFGDARDEGKLTRFVCRFKATTPSGDVRALGETLSVFPINYELVNARKNFGRFPMMTKEGMDKGLFWLSSFQFDCPVPDDVPGLREAIRTGRHVVDDVAVVYVDVVPIRTAPRVGKQYHLDFLRAGHQNAFDAARAWGDRHVLPRIDASGRWQNIPVCAPHRPVTKTKESETSSRIKDGEIVVNDAAENRSAEPENKKRHYLVGCLWTSALYKTRGEQERITDAKDRLREWLEFHFLVGFDHFYVYDNTKANTEEDGVDLSSVTDLFSPDQITRVEWPFRVCNNNIPASPNTGERSSQYAADTSCLRRYGPHTEWMASFDVDEYLIPMGKYDNLKDVLRDAKAKGNNILSFKSTRVYPNINHVVPYVDHGDCGATERESVCLQKDPRSLFVEVYNCDAMPGPKPSWSGRAKKQMYRPDHVLARYVHYSTITKGILSDENQLSPYSESSRSERFVDDLTEATMLHAKTRVPRDTVHWRTRCAKGFVPNKFGSDQCRIGFPYPKGTRYKENASEEMYTEDNYKCNCFENQNLKDVWIPKLKRALAERTTTTTKKTDL